MQQNAQFLEKKMWGKTVLRITRPVRNRIIAIIINMCWFLLTMHAGGGGSDAKQTAALGNEVLPSRAADLKYSVAKANEFGRYRCLPMSRLPVTSRLCGSSDSSLEYPSVACCNHTRSVVRTSYTKTAVIAQYLYRHFLQKWPRKRTKSVDHRRFCRPQWRLDGGEEQWPRKILADPHFS